MAGRPKEGERYPFFLWLGMNVMDWDVKVHRFVTVESPWFEVTVGKTYENYIAGGPAFLRLVWFRHRWSRLIGKRSGGKKCVCGDYAVEHAALGIGRCLHAGCHCEGYCHA